MGEEKPVGTSSLWEAIDTLVAVKIELYCHPEIAPDAMIVSAGKARSACQTIDAAIALLRALSPPFRLPDDKL